MRVVFLLSLTACGTLTNLAQPSLPECDADCHAQANIMGGECVSTPEYWADYAWPIIQRCATCHTPGGESGGSKMVFKPEVIPDYMTLNFEIFKEAATTLVQDGQPLVLLKSTNTVPHAGGRQITAGNRDYSVLLSMIEQLSTPIECPADPEDLDGDGIPDDEEVPPPLPVDEGVILHDAYGTLRKASIALAGRLPTAAEIAAVDAGGVDAIAPILDTLMTEPGFFDRIREIVNDAILTDARRYENAWMSIVDDLDNTDFPNSVPYYNNYDVNPLTVRTADSLAREPLEFFVWAAKNDLSLRTVLTGRYRMINAYSAKILGLPWDGVSNAALDPLDYDPNDYQPVAHVPGLNENMPASGQTYSEYAGILTTNAYIDRYPNTCTNMNRKIARYTYKNFLNFDIMKNAPRLDLSTVDVSAHPSRNNSQCTGCHAQIDPVAGAFQNWTRCYSSASKYYTVDDKQGSCGANGWPGEDVMFAPGTGAGSANVIPQNERHHALEILSDAIVEQQGFDEAMVTHFFVGITGRPRLDPPQDPAAPGYVNLDAAYEGQKKVFQSLVTHFQMTGRRLAPLVKAIVLSPHFRAKTAETDDRLELLGQGGGNWLTPEVLHRKVTAIFGTPWLEYADDSERTEGLGVGLLIRRDRVRIFYGGIDSHTVQVRQRLPSGLAAAASEWLALEMACEHTSRDFLRPVAQRKLFPKVEIASDETAIIENIVYLHERLLGERLSANDPEVLATLKLFNDVRADGQAAIAGGQLTANNEPICNGRLDPLTGLSSGSAQADPTYTIRAWEAVIAYMLMDYSFLFD